MNKKFISIIGAAVLTLSLVVGGVVLNGMQTVASGTQITLSVESPIVEKDEEIKVAVTASSGESMSYIKAKLTYDSNVLEFVDSSNDKVSGTNGEIYLYETLAYGECERTYELTFKALEVGTSNISVVEGSIELYESLELIDVSTSSLAIEAVVNTTRSDDARIEKMAVIGIRDIETFFNPDVYEYNLEVGVDTELFIYSATPMNGDSVIVAPEELGLDIGENYFEVRVTAPAGNEQIYVFNITRLDHELESETESETVIETESETEEIKVETIVETEAETDIEMETESETEIDIIPETAEGSEVTPVPLEETETLDADPLAAVEAEVVE